MRAVMCACVCVSMLVVPVIKFVFFFLSVCFFLFFCYLTLLYHISLVRNLTGGTP